MPVEVFTAGRGRQIVQSLVNLYSYVFGADPDAVSPAARARVDAMDFSDRRVEAGCHPRDPLPARERESPRGVVHGTPEGRVTALGRVVLAPPRSGTLHS